jgi:hypothetical protein
MIESPTEPESGAKPATNGSASAPTDELECLLERNAERFAALFRDLRILGSVDAERARLRLCRWMARVRSLVAVSVGTIVLLAAAAVILAVGVDGAFRALFADRPWLGDLVAGLVLIVSIAATWLGVRAATDSAEAERLERKYADLERDRAARS